MNIFFFYSQDVGIFDVDFSRRHHFEVTPSLFQVLGIYIYIYIFICYYFWMFLIFIGCFPTKMYNCSVTSHILRAVFFHGLKVRTTADGKVQHALLLDPCVFHTSKYILAVERQSVCFCFMIRQCCKMETKVNLESPTFLFPKVQPA